MRGDGTGKLSRYADAIAEVAEARRAGVSVLVHCAAGARRSAAVISMYQLLVERRDAAAVYDELDRFGKRSVADSPLLPYLNENMQRARRAPRRARRDRARAAPAAAAPAAGRRLACDPRRALRPARRAREPAGALIPASAARISALRGLRRVFKLSAFPAA